MHTLNNSTWKVGLVAVAVAAVAGVIGWLGLRGTGGPALEPAASSPVAQQPPLAEPPAPAAVATIRHPVATAQGTPYAGAGPTLPALDASDEAAAAALTSLLGTVPLQQIFNLDGFARRIVATIDNLPRAGLAQRVTVLRPIPGRVLVIDDNGKRELDPRNDARYAPYVGLLTAVDTSRLVGIYVHFYPILQQAYRELGYPDAYFNDRVIAVIDHLVSAPDPTAPIPLAQPRVLYTFDNPELEALSVGQKMMIRMGSENAAQAKAKLRDLRAHLVALSR